MKISIKKIMYLYVTLILIGFNFPTKANNTTKTLTNLPLPAKIPEPSIIKKQTNKQIKNLIMIINVPAEEFITESTTVDPTTIDFAIAFAQNSAPIITTTKVFKSFLDLAKKQPYIDYSKKDLKLLAPGKPQPKDITVESLESKLNLLKSAENLSSFAYLLKKEKWLYFTDSEKKIFLLIPKKEIIKKNLVLTNFGFNADNIKILSENLINSNKLSEELSVIIKQQEKNHFNKNTEDALNTIKKMFLNKMHSPNNWWNIYLIGHGDYAYSKKNKFAAISENAMISGFPFSQFKDLMIVLNGGTKNNPGINTLFLVYLSCFTGGYSQALIKSTLNKLKTNFFTAALGIGDLSVSPNDKPKIKIDPKTNHTKINFPYSFHIFFQKLKIFFSDSPQKIVKKKGQDPLISIMHSIVGYDAITNNNQPFIYIPKVGTFGTVNLDKCVVILTSSIAKAYEFENKNIYAEAAGLLVYPSRINVNINIDSNTRLISLQTPTWEKRIINKKETLIVPANYQLIHYIKSLTIYDNLSTQKPLLDFFYHLLLSKSPFMDTWLFKTIKYKSQNKEQTINNVMVFGKLPGTIYIYYQDKAQKTSPKTFLSKIPISYNFAYTESKDFNKELKAGLNDGKFQNISNSDFKDMMKLLNLESKFSYTTDSMNKVFEYLANKTKKTTDVQEPGKLRKILESKIKKIDPLRARIETEYQKQIDQIETEYQKKMDKIDARIAKINASATKSNAEADALIARAAKYKKAKRDALIAKIKASTAQYKAETDALIASATKSKTEIDNAYQKQIDHAEDEYEKQIESLKKQKTIPEIIP